MMQDKFLQDLINYRKYGMKYALEQVSKDCICKTCGTKHGNTVGANKCCK